MEILAYSGVGVFVVGALLLIVKAFQVNVWWGLGCLLISPISLVFLLMYWQEAKNPFFIQVAGLAIIWFAGYTTGGSIPSSL
jgi:4-hydroxybenzoate polyprenyltransferase